MPQQRLPGPRDREVVVRRRARGEMRGQDNEQERAKERGRGG